MACAAFEDETLLFIIQVKRLKTVIARLTVGQKDQGGRVFKEGFRLAGTKQGGGILKGEAHGAVKLPVFTEHFDGQSLEAIVLKQLRSLINEDAERLWVSCGIVVNGRRNVRDNRRPDDRIVKRLVHVDTDHRRGFKEAGKTVSRSVEDVRVDPRVALAIGHPPCKCLAQGCFLAKRVLINRIERPVRGVKLEGQLYRVIELRVGVFIQFDTGSH